MNIRFEWDSAKAATNWQDHGVTFEQAVRAFRDPFSVEQIDDREDYGEDRWQGIGLLQGRVVVVVFTDRDPDIIHIISLRKADRDERRAYEAWLQDQLDTS